MFRSLFSFILILILFTACGPEPTPHEKARDDAMAAMRAKMRAGQQHRFAHTDDALAGKIVQKRARLDTGKKRLDDPTAYVYKGKVLNTQAESIWKKEGISNTEYPQWAELKIKAAEVKAWKTLDISYAAITVFKEAGYTPKSSKEFMNRSFTYRPVFYGQFGTPVYEFDSICQGVIKRQAPPFAFLEEKCLPYMKESHKNEVIGHLLDETKIKKGPLPLEYLAELRRLATTNKEIQSGMEVSIEEFIEDEDTENFTYLFPLLKTEPTDDEMNFIRDQKLPLEKEERFFSYKNPQYWLKKAAAEDAARKAAAHQEALLRAKELKAKRLAIAQAAEEKVREKQRVLKQKQAKAKALAKKKALAREQKAAAVCGIGIKPDQLSKKKVYIAGKIVFTVEDHGDKMFGYGIKNSKDSKVYFVRDPKDKAKQFIGKYVIWRLKTMGRTEALSKVSKKEYIYDKKSKTKFTMALFISECDL